MAQQRMEEIRQQRLATRQKMLEAGYSPYPAEAQRTHTAQDFTRDFEQLRTTEQPVTVVGRVQSIRSHGSIAFVDIKDGTGSMQLQAEDSVMPADIFLRLTDLDAGDFIQASGRAISTKRGVPSLQTLEFHILTKSIRPVPTTWFGLKDEEKRYRQRELDLLLNDEQRQILQKRTVIMHWLRQAFVQRGFLEVETPILQPLAGGAAAEPFVTHHNALHTDLYLRIAPELYLKRLLVAGFEKIFEIGRNFRNEGIDRQHNPEFTMCELYWAYADYEDLMDLTETVMCELVQSITGSTELTYQDTVLSFKQPWRRVSYADIMREHCSSDVMSLDVAGLQNLLHTHRLAVPAVISARSLLDELFKKVVRPQLMQPTLVHDYPIMLAPLAKASLSNPNIAEKFQLVTAGMELVNAYTELNDPVEQQHRFELQQTERTKGDPEAHPVDAEYIQALEYGMPPAAGWGLGFDRLVALLTNTPNIRDTMAFPLLRPLR